MKKDVWKEEKLSKRSPSRTRRDADNPPVHFSSPCPDNRYAGAHRQLHPPSRKLRTLVPLNSVSTSEPSRPDWEGQLSTSASLVPMVLREDELFPSSLNRTKNPTVEAAAGNEAEARSLPDVFVKPSSTRTTPISTRAANSTLAPTASQHIESFMATSSDASLVDHPTAQTSPIDGVSKLATLLHSNPEDPYIVSSLNTHSCASSSSSASATTSALSRASVHNTHTQVSDKNISNLHNRPFSPAFINTARVFPSKPDRNLPHISLSSAMPTSITAAPSTSNRMLGGSDSPAQQAATSSSLAAHCHPVPASTLPENISLEYTHNFSLPTVSKAINTAATNDPSAIATATYTTLCMAEAVSPSQDLSSRPMSLKRLLAKPAPIFVNPPVGYAGYTTGAEDLHDGPRKVLSKSDLRGGWEETTTSLRTEDGCVKKFRKEYEEDTAFGKQDDLIAIFPSGGSSSVAPVTTRDRQTTVQRSNFDAGAGRTSTCNTAIEIGSGPEFSSGHGDVKGRCVKKLWSPIKDEMVVKNKERAPKKNVLRRKRSVGERLHNTRNFSNTDLPGASQPEDSKGLTSSAVGRHLPNSNEVHMVSVAAADASAGFVYQHPRMHQSCNELVFNSSRPAIAMYDDAVHSVTDRQSMKEKREYNSVRMKLPSASLIEECENKRAQAQGITEEQNRRTRLRHADEDNTIGGGKIVTRRGQRNVSPGNEGRTLSTTTGISPFLIRREWDEPQRRVGRQRSDSKQGKIQPWRGAGAGLGEDETLDSSTALQFSKHRDTGYILAVGRSGDSSDDCDYSDSPDSKSVGHGTSLIQKPSFTKRRKGVMSDHGHGHAGGSGGSAPATLEGKLKVASWENCKQKGMGRAARRSDKRSPKSPNILEKDNLTKGAGKPPGKPNNRKSWWGLMRKFSVSITRDRRIKPSPSMPALSDWSRSTVTLNLSTAPTTLGQPQSSSEYPAAAALERHIVNPSVLEKAYSQEEEKNESNLQPQVEELLEPLVPPCPNTPREGDWVRSQSPDIELVSLALPPRKPSKQVSPAERQVHSVHSFASLGENDSGSPMIPTFSINEAINAFPSPSRMKTLSYTGLTQADTPVLTTSGSSTRDPPDSASPPVASSNPSSIPTPRHLKSSRKSSVKRLPSVDVDGVPPSTVHNRHRSKSTGAESNRSSSPPTAQTTESPSEHSNFPLHLAFVRSQLALSASASSAVIRPGTPNTFGSVRPGTSESINSVASEMTIMASETGRFVSPALARQLSSPSDAANVDGILRAILDAL